MNTAMILAAGRGERLRPLTDITPKALTTVHGIPLIEYHITHLAQAGFNRIIINHAHLGGQIRHHLGQGSRWGIEMMYVPEPPGGLETGGGIVNALPLLGESPFLTVNADIFTSFDFSTISLPTKSLAHLILVPKPHDLPYGDFGLSNKGILTNTPKHHTFSGIACYHPELFTHQKPGRYSVTPLLRQLATEGRATGEIYQGAWIDIGTLARLQQAQTLK
jgi:N-acetyl-alpha-D-muramate 1-phosphate uridylyltransferase